jgi:hypothetical protein
MVPADLTKPFRVSHTQLEDVPAEDLVLELRRRGLSIQVDDDLIVESERRPVKLNHTESHYSAALHHEEDDKRRGVKLRMKQNGKITSLSSSNSDSKKLVLMNNSGPKIDASNLTETAKTTNESPSLPKSHLSSEPNETTPRLSWGKVSIQARRFFSFSSTLFLMTLSFPVVMNLISPKQVVT